MKIGDRIVALISTYAEIRVVCVEAVATHIINAVGNQAEKEGHVMRNTLSAAVLVVATVVTLSACSARTMAALEEEQKNGAHFATWRHMGYSLNRGTPETTTKQDIDTSQHDQCLPNQVCRWWGEVVMVQPIQ